MNHCGDGGLIWFEGVDNPVAVGNQLASVFVVEFGHLAAGSREAGQGSGRGQNCSDDGLRMGGGIQGNVRGNRFNRRGPEATRLLGKPLAQPLLYVVLRECPLLFGVFQAVAHFIEDVEMALDVLKRAVFGEFVEEGFDLLLGGGHREIQT